MARKSAWADFSDNFNSVYGTFNKLGKNIESGKVMKAEYLDDQGNALSGDALDRKRTMALADVYTKYGDAEGGLKLRSQQTAAESSKRANDLNRDLYAATVEQNGLLKTAQMKADRANTNARTGLTGAQANRVNTLVPFESDAMGLQNRVSATEAVTAEAVQPSDAAAKISNNEADVAANDVSQFKSTVELDQLSAEEQELVNINQGDYRTPEDAQAAYLQAITANNRIDPVRKAAIVEAVNSIGLAQLQSKGTEIATQAQLAVQEGGLDSLVEYYDTLDDGSTLEIARFGEGGTLDGTGNAGDIKVFQVENGERFEIFSGSGEDAEATVTQELFNQLSRPGTAIEVAASIANLEKTKAQTLETEAVTGLRNEQADSEVGSQALVAAQTDKVKAEIAAIGAGLGDAAKISLKGLGDLTGSAEFNILDPIAKQDAVGAYKSAMGMEGAPPAGVPGSVWNAMTDLERQSFAEGAN
tara:strand:- start:282 stop:1700 length:1419 start_codon:yes stop_codon:yes gene_type:complete